MDKLDITLKGDQKELVIRQGHAEPIELPNKLEIAGQIESVSRFIAHRNSEIDKKQTNIVVNRRLRNVFLSVDEQSNRGFKIMGCIKENPDLQNFQINANKIYNLKEMGTLIRQNRIFFKDRNNSDVLKNLQRFSFDKKTSGKIHDDRKGNTDNSFQSTLNQNITLDFFLEIPIYEGFKPSLFKVEIFVEVTDASVGLWFESEDLTILKKDLIDNKIDQELEKIGSVGNYLIIEE